MSVREVHESSEPTAGDSGPCLRRAWAGVALVPVFFVIAFAVGEGIYAVMGYRPEDADAPIWAVVAASAVVLLVVLIPCVAAVHFGRRAVKGGDRRGAVPAVIDSEPLGSCRMVTS